MNTETLTTPAGEIVTATERFNALGLSCGWNVTTPSGDVVPVQHWAYVKAFVANGCPA